MIDSKSTEFNPPRAAEFNGVSHLVIDQMTRWCNSYGVENVLGALCDVLLVRESGALQRVGIECYSPEERKTLASDHAFHAAVWFLVNRAATEAREILRVQRPDRFDFDYLQASEVAD